MTKTASIVAALGCSCAAASAFAQSSAGSPSARPGWYAAAELGSARSGFGSDNVASVLERQGLGGTGVTVDRTATDWSLYAGYRFTPYFSLEGGYVDLGRREFSAIVAAPGTGTISGRSHPQGLFVRAVGTLPINDAWSVFGRLGVANTRARLAASGTGSAASFDEQTRWHADATFGFGAAWRVARNTDVLLTWDRWNGIQPDYSGKDFKVDTVNVGLRYRF